MSVLMYSLFHCKFSSKLLEPYEKCVIIFLPSLLFISFLIPKENLKKKPETVSSRLSGLVNNFKNILRKKIENYTSLLSSFE